MPPVRPLDTFLEGLGRFRRRFSPTETLGAPGTAIFGGFVIDREKEPRLHGVQRYRTFSEILANCTIAAAGVRYFINLIAKADWQFVPAEHPDGERLAELAEEMITQDPSTPWTRIIRRAAMYRFYGFSLQEWVAFRREDGFLSFADISPRPQVTITQWDANTDGSINGAI